MTTMTTMSTMNATPELSERLFQLFPLRQPDWRRVLTQALRTDVHLQRTTASLLDYLHPRREALLPSPRQVFAALEATALPGVKVIILGQDPYPTTGDAHGLAFSVQRRSELPRSLRNVGAEVERDTGKPLLGGDLSRWAGQGVLLLNAVLTLQQGAEAATARSHQGQGWEDLTAVMLRSVLARPAPCIVLCWGKKAATTLQALGALPDRVSVLYATHPSPLSCHRAVPGFPAFRGCGHFSQANAILRGMGLAEITWSG